LPKKGFIINAAIISSQVFSDFLIGGLGYFNNTGIPALALIGLLLGLIRLNKRIRKKWYVFVFYWFGIILTLDFVYILVATGADCFGKRFPLFIIFIYISILYLRGFRRLLYFMTPIQIVAIPIILIGVTLKWGELWNPQSACLAINNQPGVKILSGSQYDFTKLPHTAIPRFFVPRPERGDVLVCDHVYVHEENVIVKNAINRLDVRTGRLTPWLKKGEVIAIRRDEAAEDIYAVVQKNYYDPAAPTVEFMRFDPEGKILDRKSFGFSRGSFYGASIIIRPANVIVNVESNFFVYDKAKRSLRQFKIADAVRAPVYRSAWMDPYYYGVFATTYLFSKLFGSHHAVKINMNTKTLEASCSEDPFGFIDIARWPGRNLMAASHFLERDGWLLDGDLRKVRKIKIPPGVREIEFSNDGRYLIAAGFIGGKFYAIDPVKNEIVGSGNVGNGSRGLTISPDGTVLIGSSCGVVAIRLDEFLRSGRDAAIPARKKSVR
jgi:hypothetical protein